MGRVRRTQTAKQDLIDIWNYIAEDNPRAADRETEELSSVFDDLSGFPRLGRKRPDLGKNILTIAHSNY